MTVKISLPPSANWAGSVGRQTIGSLGSSEDSTNGSLKKPNFNERHPKVVRSLTVVAYIFSVSLAAIILSAYYVVLWTPKVNESPKNNNAKATNLSCRGVTYGPEGTIEYVPQSQYYRQGRVGAKYYSIRHRPRTSKLVSYNSKTEPPHQIIDYDLSLQRDSPSVGNYTSPNETGKASAPPFDDQLETIEPSVGTNGREKIATSIVPNSPSPPEPTPNSIILRKLLTAKSTTGRTR